MKEATGAQNDGFGGVRGKIGSGLGPILVHERQELVFLGPKAGPGHLEQALFGHSGGGSSGGKAFGGTDPVGRAPLGAVKGWIR